MKSPIIILTESLPSKVEVAEGGLGVVLEVVHVQWPHSPGSQEQRVGGPVWSRHVARPALSYHKDTA